MNSESEKAIEEAKEIAKKHKITHFGGFFKLPESAQCNNAEHNPPTGLYIPQGYGYRHICPSCGKEQIVRPIAISYSDDKS